MASNRFPIIEPFAGGLEAITHGVARELLRRGHEVSVFAAPGSDPHLPLHELPVPSFTPSDLARSDVSAPPDQWMAEHHAYLGLMLDLARTGAERYDVVHNHSLHHLPVAMADLVPVPMITTLHTPPTPWLESAIALSREASTFTAVSRCTARGWSHAVRSTTILNGIDPTRWHLGPGGGPAVWSGRIVPEKAPHDALDAARHAGIPLVVAGHVGDPGYFRHEILPRLDERARYAGHLTGRELAVLLGRASVALVTPAWDEPYGLVSVEAMACGTPVAGYARGALPEIVSEESGVLVEPGDVTALAHAVSAAQQLDRRMVREHAVRRHSIQRMIDEYEELYGRLIHGSAA